MSKIIKPDLFQFHDHIYFLNEWFSYLKSTKREFNLRELSKKSQISVANLSMLLKRQRPLTEKTFFKLAPFLNLNDMEKKFLNLLRIVDQSEDAETRLMALNQIVKIAKFRENNSQEFKAYEYLTKWFYVSIFEMSALEDFKLDAEWIQNHLIKPISIAEIQQAIQFLLKQNFLKQNADGSIKQIRSHLDCREGIFKVSLGAFHRQMLDLAGYAIENISREDRIIMGQTMAIAKEDFEQIKEIINNAILNINKINSKTERKDAVYHVEIAAFPLSLKSKEI
ncbi:MAG: hypothetical protein A2622_12705 [Bdellovibrionales bacterium RIFCSPHIGHO2_01_FULL_40_29]|nr:MAG: hypothetical protein A2622_12705 [Bdellovibrionales bacterium RIFCSPHIGHO2_01_FULL_40_29]OFZ33445.1 MAG: hypothetical protein A3D17_14180 [Bdellovibrionales bacterium RIFCSPHIGHO2_02_FULL_40_15]